MRSPDDTARSLDEALRRIYSRRSLGVKLRLETERSLLARLGDPHLHYATIHVAGTNGKGSVCALLESVLRAAGYRTALYTSPHLINFNERIRTNGTCISDAELIELLRQVDAHCEAVAAQQDGRQITFFEFATALAFEHFSRKQTEIAVIETGLGGRLDATNVIDHPLLSIITGISLEHTAYLGPDIPSITVEKCGIVKPGVPVVRGPLPDEATAIVERVARERGCRIIAAPHNVVVTLKDTDPMGQKILVETQSDHYGTMRLPLLGKHQLANVGTTMAALDVLGALLPGNGIAPKSVRKGIETVHWPGRCQLLSQDPPVLVDGAHNPEAAEALAQTLDSVWRNRKLGLIFGACTDKDAKQFLKPLVRRATRCWTVPLNDERSADAADLAAIVRGFDLPVTTLRVPEAMTQAEQWARAEDGIVCITGSLYLVGEVLEAKLGKGGLCR